MERVLWPMEPVEPRMASFFTQLFSQILLSKVFGRGFDARIPDWMSVWTTFRMDKSLFFIAILARAFSPQALLAGSPGIRPRLR